MPKVTLEYNLPEDREEYEMAMNGSHNYSILFELQNYLRVLRKYDDRETVPKQEILDKLYELLTDFQSQ